MCVRVCVCGIFTRTEGISTYMTVCCLCRPTHIEETAHDFPVIFLVILLNCCEHVGSRNDHMIYSNTHFYDIFDEAKLQFDSGNTLKPHMDPLTPNDCQL